MNLDPARYLAMIGDDAGRFGRAVERGPLEAPVRSCPGWDLRELTIHAGMAHRWATLAVAHARPPERGETALPAPGDDLAPTRPSWTSSAIARSPTTGSRCPVCDVTTGEESQRPACAPSYTRRP